MQNTATYLLLCSTIYLLLCSQKPWCLSLQHQVCFLFLQLMSSSQNARLTEEGKVTYVLDFVFFLSLLLSRLSFFLCFVKICLHNLTKFGWNCSFIVIFINLVIFFFIRKFKLYKQNTIKLERHSLQHYSNWVFQI